MKAQWGSVKRALAPLKIGQAVIVNAGRPSLYNAATRMRIRIRTRPTEQGYLVRRIA